MAHQDNQAWLLLYTFCERRGALSTRSDDFLRNSPKPGRARCIAPPIARETSRHDRAGARLAPLIWNDRVNPLSGTVWCTPFTAIVPPRHRAACQEKQRRAQGTSVAQTMMAHPDIRGSQGTAGAPPQESKPMGAASFYKRAFAAQRGARGLSPAWSHPSPALAVASSP